jgi:hypothetical protein
LQKQPGVVSDTLLLLVAVCPLRPSRIFGDEEIAATGADYLALGHCDRPMCVGNGAVPAFHSGSPELARTVNLVRLTAGGVVVTREPLIWPG